MSTRRSTERITPRLPVFMGCGGHSEFGYAAWLQSIANSLGNHIHIEHPRIPTGDFLSIVEKSVDKMNRLERVNRAFRHRAVLLDGDEREMNPGKNPRAYSIAAAHRITLLWQEPDFEGFLLRHFPGFDQARPARGESIARLKKVWRGYRKPPAADEIGKRLGLEDLRRVCAVEQSFAAFLRQIGFPV